MRARATAMVAGVALCVALGAGCGGDSGPSADEYRAELDQACVELFDGLDALSQQATEGDLETEEVQDRADALGDQFESTVADLEPPDELADAHQAMVDLGDEAPDDDAGIDAFLQYQRDNLEAFEALGADECAARERTAIEQLENAN